MRCYKDIWYYKGRAYATCREALLAAWPKEVSR